MRMVMVRQTANLRVGHLFLHTMM